nr:MAG TPA: hypothetical protein [Caudoviricetes sp.]
MYHTSFHTSVTDQHWKRALKYQGFSGECNGYNRYFRNSLYSNFFLYIIFYFKNNMTSVTSVTTKKNAHPLSFSSSQIRCLYPLSSVTFET